MLSFQIKDMEFTATDLCLPKPNSEFLKKTFRYSGAMQWNHLSEDSKNTETLSSFKRKIRRQAA
jgi:hypothetical protein